MVNIYNQDEIKLKEDGQIRPSYLDDFIGQKDIVSNLSVFLKAAISRKKALDHVLLSGPPGLGKTTLAHIIAKELNVNLQLTSAPTISKGADLAKILTSLNENDILFIDEIHTLNRKLEEILYPAMENFQIDLIVGEGITAQSIQIPLKPFTLIGATTRSGQISDPLKTRFGINLRLEYYNEEEMTMIIKRSAGILGIPIEDQAAKEIAKRSRKTPRIANHLLKRIQDFSEVNKDEIIKHDLTLNAFGKLGINELGLDEIDRQILRCIIERYQGGPVGLKAIAVIIGEEEKTIEDTYESFMVQIGLINRTPSGRVATEEAYRQLNLEYQRKDRTLF